MLRNILYHTFKIKIKIEFDGYGNSLWIIQIITYYELNSNRMINFSWNFTIKTTKKTKKQNNKLIEFIRLFMFSFGMYETKLKFSKKKKTPSNLKSFIRFLIWNSKLIKFVTQFSLCSLCVYVLQHKVLIKRCCLLNYAIIDFQVSNVFSEIKISTWLLQ
jgi:hypothetical protein